MLVAHITHTYVIKAELTSRYMEVFLTALADLHLYKIKIGNTYYAIYFLQPFFAASLLHHRQIITNYTMQTEIVLSNFVQS